MVLFDDVVEVFDLAYSDRYPIRAPFRQCDRTFAPACAPGQNVSTQ
jgi:hypothetical protein